MKNYFESNKELWNRLTAINAQSKMYDVIGFKAGQLSLKSIEIEEVGDVKGKKLLHLQCHFGMDTLSWARLGAEVVGVDFSPDAIHLARKLSEEVKIDARFLEVNLYELPSILNDEFDIVYTSYGVLCWLPDLWGWADVIAYFLKPNGIFHLIETHPFNNIFENEKNTRELKIRYPYFHSAEPIKWEDNDPYADRTKKLHWPSYEWTHSLSDIINSLIQAGLQIEHFHEFPYCVYDQYPFLEKCEDGWYRFKGGREIIPLMFSLKARKP